MTGIGAWADPPQYAPLPQASTPFEDPTTPQALLRPPPSSETTDFQIGFDTRSVDIQSYVKTDSSLGIDSVSLWQTHYAELSDYLDDALAASRKHAIYNDLLGDRKLSDSAQNNTNRYELPVKIPEWAKRLGLSKPALTLTGSYTLQLKATSHWTSADEADGTANKVPDFSPEQIPNINLVGNIGKFVSLSLTWNQQGFGATQNQDLHIKYAGEKPEDTEDDILQEAEFGQIQMSLAGTSLTGYTETAAGMLGVRARMKFGDFDLTVVGGSQTGEQQKGHIGRGTTSTTSPLVRDRDIQVGYDLFLSYAWRKKWINANKSLTTSSITIPSVLYVYQRVTATEVRNHSAWSVAKGSASVYDSTGAKGYTTTSGQYWHLLTYGTDYVWQNGVLRMTASGAASSGEALAATWTSTTDSRGSGGGKTVVDLALLYADDHDDADIRLVQLRNRYYKLPTVTEANRSSVSIKITDLTATTGDASVDSAGTSWVQTFHLADANGKLKYDDATIFDWTNHAIIFPDLEPFRTYGRGVLYDTLRTALSTLSARFAIEITAKSTSDSIQIGSRDAATVSGSSNCVDITQNSETLTLNGSTKLERGVDYSVQYSTGTILLLSSRARDASASIDIAYSCTPFFSLENRTVAGARLEYKLPQISKESLLGATFLYRSETTSDSRTQLGREGSSAMLWGANLKLAGESEFITDITDRIPLVKAKADSKWNFELEGAQSRVNPNPSGYALVDDFESSLQNNEFPLSRTSWYQASPPGGVPVESDYEDSLSYKHQGELVWSSNSTAKLADIYPNHDDGTGTPAEQSLLHLRFTPNEKTGAGMSWGGMMRAMPSSYRDFSSSHYLEVVVQATGGELNFDIGDVSEDLSLDGNAPDGVLEGENIDTAGVAHSAALNNCGTDGICDADESVRIWTCYRLSCQDTVRTHNGVLDPASDDFKADAISRDPDRSIDGTEGNQSALGSSWINTEDLDGNGALDTLNSFNRYRIVLGGTHPTSYQKLKNGYRLYRIALDKPFVKKGGGATWSSVKNVRIWYGGLTTANGANLLREDAMVAKWELVGNQWTQTGHMSANDDTTVVDSTYSGDWSSLTKVVSEDSSRLDVSTIGVTSDTNYVSWGVPEVTDATTGAKQNEQALRLAYKELHRDFATGSSYHADTGSALRTYDNARDFTLYKNLSMLVYHQAAEGHQKAGDIPVRFAIQLGSGDPSSASAPYYEYSFDPKPTECPLGDSTASCATVSRADRVAAMKRDWEDNEIKIALKTLTNLKTLRDAAGHGSDTIYRKAVSAPTGRLSSRDSIAVYGDPSISSIRWMRLWVRPNPVGLGNSSATRASGEIWVNDLELSDPHKAFGSALRASAQMNFSDLLDISGSAVYKAGDFVPMGSKQSTLASEASTASVTGTARLSMDKFLPEAWKAQLPVSVTFNGSVSRPWSRPSSDQELTHDGLEKIVSDWWNNDMRRDSADIANRTSRAYETMNVSRTVSASWTRARAEGPGVMPILANTFFARPKVSWTYTESGTLAPENRDSTWNHNLRLDYDLTPPQTSKLKPFSDASASWVPKSVKDFSIQPWPTSITTTLGDLSYAEATHTVLAPDKDSLPRSWTHTRTANLSHSLAADWPLFDFFKVSLGAKSSRTWSDDLQETHKFDPSTGLVDAWPLIFDWDTTHVRSPKENGGAQERQTLGLLRNETGRSTNFSMDLSPKILPWFTNTGSFQATSALSKEAVTKTLDSYGDTVRTQFWTHTHTDDFKATLKLDVPSVFKSLQNILPDSWSKSVNETRQGFDRWRWNGIGLDYSVDDRISGVRQTLDYTSYSENMTAGTLALWQMGLGDQDGFRSPWDLVTGSRSKSGFGQYAPSRLNNSAQYLNMNDTAAVTTGSDRSSEANVRTYRVSTSTDFTVPGILLGVQPSLAYQISWTERWASPWDVDTTKTWPQITVNLTLANFAGRVPLLSKWFQSVTLNHSTTWEKQQQIYPHAITSDVDNYTWRMSPVVGLAAKTKGNWSFDDKTNYSVTLAKNYLKTARTVAGKEDGICNDGSGLAAFYTDENVTTERCFDPAGTTITHNFDVGNEGTATYRIQTKKGIQILKWFVKLDNDLVVTFKAGWTEAWKTLQDYNTTTGEPEESQTTSDVTTVYVGSNASYNFTSKLSANFDASYKRTSTKTSSDATATVANDISLLASLQYKF